MANRLTENDEADENQYDPYVNAEVFPDDNDTQFRGVVKGQKQEQDGTVSGKAN